MLNPISTYRLQIHKDFTLENVKKIIPYLEKLGVKTLYFSPVFEAVPGSMHGYDGVNPLMINPEAGNKNDVQEISALLKEKGMYWLQDIVPNHMAFHQNNRWLSDVLEKGNKSIYAGFFDIIKNNSSGEERLMVPFLGAPFADVVRSGEIELDFCSGRLVFRYYGNLWPVRPESYLKVLESGKQNLPQEIILITDKIKSLAKPEVFGYAERWEQIRVELGDLFMKNNAEFDFSKLLKLVNTDPRLLEEIESEQHYKLCFWQDTDRQINYRRFFTINGLICLNIQEPDVFDEYHKYIKELLDKKIIQGLRIDHIDGLYNPAGYLKNLRELAGEDCYIIAEKILEHSEKLPEDWPLQGNTGYDFLAAVNNLLTNKASEEKFTAYYKELTGNSVLVDEQIKEKKAFILWNNMTGELDNLTRLFIDSELADKNTLPQLPEESLRKAIAELLVNCPVYRFYGNIMPLPDAEKSALKDIFSRIGNASPELSEALGLLRHVLTEKPAEGDQEYNSKVLHFYRRLMQFTGPLMAKGVEDTLMYTYNRYIGNNEVGDSPETFGIDINQFHQQMQGRQKKLPLSLNATATHDTKRGEDVSARINVLTDIADDWFRTVSQWREMNIELKTDNKPDANDEYFIYQTLIGSYPFDAEEQKNYGDRLKAFITKALREGKVNSGWTSPDLAYEEAAGRFTDGLLRKDSLFWNSFELFYSRVADAGIVNSLIKVLLKFTCPGVPDVYQGCEKWDFSMVDPDNRRPVDYKSRVDWLDTFLQNEKSPESLLSGLWEKRKNADIKLWLIHTLLKFRNENADLFEKGEYIPLEVQGRYSSHLMAFARKYKQQWVIVAVPLGLASLSSQKGTDWKEVDWADTSVVLPEEAPDEWTDLLSKSAGSCEGLISAAELFSTIPFAFLNLQFPVTDRSAGVLLHITSLPSRFGAGDFGPEARRFTDFLAKSRQKYWQLLPLNITEAGMGFSPYSSISSLAGNVLLLSPELMAEDGLLEFSDLEQYELPVTAAADFDAAQRIKDILCGKAYQKFRTGAFPLLQAEYDSFCKKEIYWLQDFAIYAVLRNHLRSEWYQWPDKLKKRNKNALKEFSEGHAEELEKVKWLQFMFFRQWAALRSYCNNLDIKLFGDLPFYVSYESADVWANPDIFKLDENGRPVGIAGVPPDYFNSDGQLWGMPVFRWDILRARNYDWWVTRLKKNIELYDVVRLDHFRAFYDYWEVPANSPTAKTGKWMPGPGNDFFDYLKKELGDLPFIAEDLGDINEGVHKLRDTFQLPGMKILQFAFGKDIPGSIYIPHNFLSNYIAYTGTHDNNTTVGWFRQDTGLTEKKNIEKYTGIRPDEGNIHIVLGRLAYSSVAKTVILPVQDILGLDEKSRMNIPASVDRNWVWRLLPDQLNDEHKIMLRNWVKIFNR
jgi:malto-oligosyltrehalose synthase/4-alpha-glucanotransferase